MKNICKDLVTIVIPCKNEKTTISTCIELISKQVYIDGTTVIIADSSTEEYSKNIVKSLPKKYKNVLDIKIIEGGYPATARLNGSKLVKTPHVLFLDADMELHDISVILDTVLIRRKLVTVPIRTDYKYNWIFRLFDYQQNWSIKLGIPFAVGAFQLWNTDYYWSLGGYDPEHIFAEDFALSKKSSDMYIHNTNGVYTSPRRFENKGVFYMAWILMLSYFNRNDNEFFKKSHGYWK
jgi:glycosyltransferase involved in cell wall biosynthesis